MKKPTVFLSLRGRIAAVAIFKPKVWHPVAKYGKSEVRPCFTMIYSFAV